MATQFEVDCVLMSGLAYQTTRDKVNWFAAPGGWQEFSHIPNSSNPTAWGFEAGAFQSATTGEIVISFAGTDPADVLGDILTDMRPSSPQKSGPSLDGPPVRCNQSYT